MKRILFAAAGLLIATSANAFAPSAASKDVKVASMPSGGAVGLKATVAKFDKDDALAMVQPAAMGWGKPGKPDVVLAGELGGPSLLGKPDMSQYTGMGGPLEEVDYPACSRTVRDRCIQLYERGVSRR